MDSRRFKGNRIIESIYNIFTTYQKIIMNFSASKKLIKNSKNFLNIKHYSFLNSIFYQHGIFYGWGRKESGLKAIQLTKKFNTSFVLLEDGFIRSLSLGINNSPSFSLIEDDIGIYYDATKPSKLENILNTYVFNESLLLQASDAIKLIQKHYISKYNHAQDVPNDYFDSKEEKVLIIAQTAGDSSLEYGMLDNYSTDDMINSALLENPHATLYLKIHPDVLSGKKESDIDIESAKIRCRIIQEDVNPLSLLKHFSKVYTKTSQMGFEALLVGCECICFGMPFYAGWGLTDDRSICKRRTSKRSIEEVFAAAYILYTRYYNPYKKRPSDIFDTIDEIILQKKKLVVKNKTVKKLK